MPQFHASNPAKIKVQLGHFLKCDLKDVIILVASVLLAAAVVAFSWKLALILLLLGPGVAIYSMFEARKVFAEGDVCPAIVIDADRNLIAAYADLSKTEDEYPVIKVLKQPLGRVAGGPFKNGTRLALVAMYNGFPQEPNWRSFGGYLANAGTTKKKVVQRVVNSVPEADWQRLEDGIAQLEQPYSKGQYEDLDI